MEYLKFCLVALFWIKSADAVLSTDAPQTPAPIPKGEKPNKLSLSAIVSQQTLKCELFAVMRIVAAIYASCFLHVIYTMSVYMRRRLSAPCAGHRLTARRRRRVCGLSQSCFYFMLLQRYISHAHTHTHTLCASDERTIMPSSPLIC